MPLIPTGDSTGIEGGVQADSPARNILAVNVSTTDYVGEFRAIYVGVTGNIVVDGMDSGTSVLFTAVPAGCILPVWGKRIATSGTTATGLVVLW